MGALYVDSRFASRDISSVSNDILRAIATEAASLIENARLVQAEEKRRGGTSRNFPLQRPFSSG